MIALPSVAERYATRSGHRRTTAWIRVLAASLFVAAGIHFAVAFEHAGSVFGLLAFAAGLGQLGLGIGTFVRPSSLLFATASLLSLVVIQLFILNVTVGLPPLIAHTHVAGTHTILGITLSRPNALDVQGAAALLCEIGAVVCARGATRSGAVHELS